MMRTIFGIAITLLVLCHFSFEQDQGTTTTTGGGAVNGTTTTSTGDILTTGIIGTENATECEKLIGCGSCVGDNNCVWCKSSNSCIGGTWYGASSSCSDWRWKQCEVMGKWTLVASAGVVGLILLSFLLCVCCCCCCSRKKKNAQAKGFKSIQMEEEKETLIASKHPKTDSRREELRKKYALKSENV